MSIRKEKDHPLQRFLQAQDQTISADEDCVYEQAIRQLQAGSVPSASCLWCIFPRVTSSVGIDGQKSTAKKQSINSYEEAWEYYHEVDLSNNLMDAIDAIRTFGKTDLDEIFGKNARKFKPWLKDCLTLFVEIEADADVEEDHFFQDALQDFFGGEKSQSVVQLLHTFPDHPDNASEYEEEGYDESAEEDESGEHSITQEMKDLVNEEPMYTVNGFLASCVMDGVLLYQADWAWRRPDLSWYPATNFRNASPLLKAFHDANPDQPGPSIRLDEWLSAYHRREIADPDDEDNTPVPTSEASATPTAPPTTPPTAKGKSKSKVTKTKKSKKRPRDE